MVDTAQAVFATKEEAARFLTLRSLYSRFIVESIFPERKANFEAVWGTDDANIENIVSKDLALVRDKDKKALIDWWREVLSFSGASCSEDDSLKELLSICVKRP